MSRKPLSDQAISDAIAVKEAIDHNPLSREGLKKLVPLIHTGRNHLLPAFRQITGKPIRRYRMEKRMEAASKLLATGELTVKQVAIECGYARNHSSFTRYFKAVYKMAPEEWLHKSLKNNTKGNPEHQPGKKVHSGQ